MSDDQADEVCSAYAAHLSSVASRLPKSVRRLLQDVSLHDALILRVERRGNDEAALEVVFRAGDLQSGYVDVRATYRGVALSEADERFLCGAVGRTDIEVLYDEFDVAEPGLVHSLLFWPYHEVSLTFAAMDVEVRPAAGRFDTYRP